MIYLISRSICQGRKAGVISLCGVVIGFLVHVFAAAAGLTALLLAIPFGYDVLEVVRSCVLALAGLECSSPRCAVAVRSACITG